MIIKKALLTIIIFLLPFFFLKAATYYFSNTGNDFNNGLSASFPLRSISKLNSIMSALKPGDEVLFKRGDYFIGRINIKSGGNFIRPLTFGAYGEGKAPVISGSIPVKNWQQFSNKIYISQVDTSVKNLFAAKRQMILARYPDKGFLSVGAPLSSSPNKGFYDSHLSQKDGYWNGANIRARTVAYAYEYSPVEKFIHKTIFFKNAAMFPMQTGWGYYLDNVLSELNSENEWYFKSDDNSGGKGILYFYPPSGLNVQNIFVEASICDYGFYAFPNVSNIIIKDIEIRNQCVSGIFFNGIQNISIENCAFSGQMECGIESVASADNFVINNCRFKNINGKAIFLINSNNSVISNNIIKNIGLIPGYGTTSDPFGMSGIIILKSNQNHIFKNYIDSVGHDGINCIGHSNQIEKNIISHALLELNDGGAIKSYGNENNNSVWNNNFISHVSGNFDGIPKHSRHIAACGLYPDEYCSNMKLLFNTISGCALSGINFYNGNKNNIIEGNICFNNQNSILFFKASDPISGNTTFNNIFFGVNENQYAVLLKTLTSSFTPGNFYNNFYCNPDNDKIFAYQKNNQLSAFNFNEWEKFIGAGNDKNSKIITGSSVSFPLLFQNRNDDTIAVNYYSGHSFKDLNLNGISEIKIPPYYSRILLMDKDGSHLPALTISHGPLLFEKNISSPQWFILSAENLKDSITITSPPDFKISTENDYGYSDKIVLIPSANKEIIIFVKFISKDSRNYENQIVCIAGKLKSAVKVRFESR